MRQASVPLNWPPCSKTSDTDSPCSSTRDRPSQPEIFCADTIPSPSATTESPHHPHREGGSGEAVFGRRSLRAVLRYFCNLSKTLLRRQQKNERFFPKRAETRDVAEKSPKTKALGVGTVNLTTNVPTAMQGALKSLATASDMKIGEYCRALFNDAIDKKRTFKKMPPTETTEDK